MVGDNILYRDKYRKSKIISKFFLIIMLILLIASIIFFSGYFIKKPPINQQKIVLENPLKAIAFANQNEDGYVNKEAVIEQALLEFDTDYINYILAALGVNNLYKSKIGFGNPKVEFNLDDDVWSSEVINGGLSTINQPIEDEDILIIMSKEEIIESLLSKDIKEFMTQSVKSGRTRIDMIAGKTELLSKGYLKMYQDLTAEES